MSITVEATYEQGNLRLSQPLPLAEHARVRVTVQPVASFVAATYGLLGGKVDAQTVERVGLDPEFSVLETP